MSSKSLNLLIISAFCINAFADNVANLSGIFAGGGIGYGMQNLSFNGQNSIQSSPAFRLMAGYQFVNWIGVEAGYNYFAQTSSTWNGFNNVSTTVYDLAFTPGFTIPGSPVGIFARLGIDSLSSNSQTSLFSQIFGNFNANFEWGGGFRMDIPNTRAFVRLEYINFGQSISNCSPNLTVGPSVVMLDAGYVF